MTGLVRFGVELRAENFGKNGIRGHAAVFGQVARVKEGWEQLREGAFKVVLADPATDVRALFNHDPSRLLGRQKSGTLKVGADSQGLEFEIPELPDTSYGRDLHVLIERGDLDGASFGFVPGEDEWDQAPDGLQRRTHTSVARLVDVSPVTFPAYEGASTQLRHAEYGSPNRVRSQLVRARARVHLGRV